MRFVKNKKGGMVFPVLADIVGLFLMILLILVFLIITKWTTTPFTFSIEAKPLENYESHVQLQSILTTPVEFEGVTLEMHELIALMQTKENREDRKKYDAILKPKLESILNKIDYCKDLRKKMSLSRTIKEAKGYNLHISPLKTDGRVSLDINSNHKHSSMRKKLRAEIQLPNNQAYYVFFELGKAQGGFEC